MTIRFVSLLSKSIKIITVFSFMLFFKLNAQAQLTAQFTTQDTICIYDSLIITNLSRDASSYYWNFCSGNLAYEPAGESLINSGTLSEPAFIDFAEDNEQYFAFITNHNDGTITRNSYGNSFLEEPATEILDVLGGIITDKHLQGIQVVNDPSTGNWHAFVVGGQREYSKLVRLDFGNSLANTPTAPDFWNIDSTLDTPVDLYIVLDGGEWTGLTVNQKTNTITRFDFGASITSTPTAINLSISPDLLQTPCGILPIIEDGNWFVFISNYEGHDITRLDFGPSLKNDAPQGTSIGNSEYLNYPFDLTIIRDCERTYGFVVNRFNDVVRLEFEEGLANTPEFTSLGEIGNLFNPQGISDVFRVGDTLYAFVANIDNSTLTRLYFPGCTNAIPASSEERNPPTVKYNEPGLYNVNLVIDEGLPQQENYCLNVVVLESPDVNLGNDTAIAAGTSITLSTDSLYIAYEWSTGSSEPTIEVSEAGIYSVNITNEFGCQNTDEIEIIIDIGIPNFFTPNGDGQNDTWIIPFLETEPETEICVYDRFGNMLANFRYGNGTWDGTSGGRLLPVGTYWYVIKVPEIKKPYKGSVTIKY